MLIFNNLLLYQEYINCKEGLNGDKQVHYSRGQLGRPLPPAVLRVYVALGILAGSNTRLMIYGALVQIDFIHTNLFNFNFLLVQIIAVLYVI